MRLGLFAAGLGPVLLAAACGIGGAPDGVVADCSDHLALPPGVSTDILFVIDNSRSMAEEQEKVAAQLEGFVAALASGPVQNDFRVGVITTAVTENVAYCDPDEPPAYREFPQENGILQPATLPGEEGEGPRILGFADADLVERFAALVRRGVAGTGQEMGLEAMRRAISRDQGFLRPGARLLVVVVSDEDDCSDPTGTALAVGVTCEQVRCASDEECGEEGTYCLHPSAGRPRICTPNACETEAGRAAMPPVEEYVRFLRGLDDGTGSGRKRETFLAVIGPFDPETGAPARCASATDEASGIGVRYREAVDAMGEDGLAASICADDYGESLQRIAELVQAPHVLELENAPVDPRLLQLRIERADGSVETCVSGKGFEYEPPAGDAKARVRLEGSCRLQHGDEIEVRLFCAG